MSSNEQRLQVNENYASIDKESVLPPGFKKSQVIILSVLQLASLFTFAQYTTFQYWTPEQPDQKNPVLQYYPFFQDVNVMIFVGFGFLMTYLRRNSWTSVMFNFLVAAWSIQIAILCNGLFNCLWSGIWEKIELDVVQLIQGDFAAAAVLISFGAVLGKVNATQLFVMATFEVFFYALNSCLGEVVFGAVDMGGSCFIHAFGGIFGLAVSFIITPKAVDEHPKNEGNNTAFIFATIGTIFLWMFWPSFNGALATGLQQNRVIVSTVLSLSASCIGCFIVSTLFNNGKLSMTDVCNATLAGGVIIGTYSNLQGTQFWAICIGLVGGTISTIGFERIQTPLYEKCGIHDTCGVAHLHAIPGVFGTLCGVLAAFQAGESAYGQDIGEIYPARANGARTAWDQGLCQLIGLGITIGIALVSGIIVGFIIKPMYQAKNKNQLFEDDTYWIGVEGEKED